MLRILLILKYTQFRWMCVRAYVLQCVWVALIRYANKYRYFYANIALLSRVHVETCRIRFFNLLNWVLFCCSRSRCCCCCCCYFSWMSLFLLWIYSFGYFHLLLPSFWVDIRIGCSWLASLIHSNSVMVFGTAWTACTQLNHDDKMPHRATHTHRWCFFSFSFSFWWNFFLLHFSPFSHLWVFSRWNTLRLPCRLSASQPAIQPTSNFEENLSSAVWCGGGAIHSTASNTFVCLCTCVCAHCSCSYTLGAIE